jgi:hypothetical protein
MPSDAVPGAFFCAFAQEFHQIRAAPCPASRNKIAASQEAAMRRPLRLATAVRIPSPSGARGCAVAYADASTRWVPR